MHAQGHHQQLGISDLLGQGLALGIAGDQPAGLVLEFLTEGDWIFYLMMLG